MQAGQDIDRYLGIMRTGAWFQALPESLQEQLERLAVIRRLDAGRLLFARGDAPDGVYCVVEGAIRLTGISESGKEALLAIIEAPHWYGEIALFDGLARTHDAWSHGASVLLHFPQREMLAALRGHPDGWHHFGLLLAHKLRTAFLVLEEWALLPAPGRLARRLLSIAEGYGERKDGGRRELHVSQEQLAQMLSLSRQSVNQILKQWETRGLVRLSRGGIFLLDVDGLRALAT